MKRFIMLVLSLVMALSLCVPAWGVDEDSNGDGLPDGLPKATVVNSPEHENVDLPWGSYGSWSPTAGLDAQLEAAYTFSCAETLEEASANPYANWYCDFVVVLDKDLGANQLFLGGHYGSFEWVGFHNGELELEANTEVPLLGSVTSNPWTYLDVAQNVNTFICGVGDVDDALDGATFTVMLRLTNPNNKAEFYNVATINYVFGGVAETNGVAYQSLQDAVDAVEDGGVITVKAGGLQAVVKTAKSFTLLYAGNEEAATITAGDGYEMIIDGNNYTVMKTYTVSFNANGGDGSMADETDVSGEYTLPECAFTAPEGKQFKGWIVDGIEYAVGGKITVSADVAVTAVWEDVPVSTYTVSFSANGGDGSMADVSDVFGEYTLPECAFTAPEGKQFKAWSVDGIEYTVGDKITVSTDVAVTAVWEDVPVEEPTPEPEPDTPPAEDDPVVEDETVVKETIKDEKITSAVTPEKMMDAVDSYTNIVTVPSGDSIDAKTTLEFNVVSDDNGAAAKAIFAEATPTDISIELTVASVGKNDVDADAAAAVAEVMSTIGDNAEVAYLNIDINVLVGEQHVGQLTELPEAITISIPLESLELAPVEKGYTRQFYVVRVHDGVPETIEAELDKDGNLVFESHLFSTYAVVYEDVKTPTYNGGGYYPVVDDTSSAAEKFEAAETFDAGIALYVGVSIVAAVGSAALSKKRED